MPASSNNRRRILERRITTLARERGTTAARLRLLVGFAVLCETLAELGLQLPRSLPCVAISAQIAEKIHTLTEPEPNGRRNPRARDVLDILLLVQRLKVDNAAVVTACEGIFAERATHKRPVDSFAFLPDWHGILAELACEVRYDTDDSEIVEQRFHSYLASLMR